MVVIFSCLFVLLILLMCMWKKVVFCCTFRHLQNTGRASPLSPPIGPLAHVRPDSNFTAQVSIGLAQLSYTHWAELAHLTPLIDTILIVVFVLGVKFHWTWVHNWYGSSICFWCEISLNRVFNLEQQFMASQF